MYPPYCLFLLVAAGLYATKALGIVQWSIPTPIGPKMCERLCNELIGCSMYIFITSDLACLVNAIKADEPVTKDGTYKFSILKTKERIRAEDDLKCPRNAKIFLTRRKVCQCRRRVPFKGIRYDPGVTILMLPCSDSNTPLQGRQLYLHSKSSVPYPYLEKGVFRAVAFLPSTQRLLVVTTQSLFTVSMDGGNKNLLSHEFFPTAITVDEDRQLFFHISRSALFKMSTEDTTFSWIAQMEVKVESIAADIKRSMIYVKSNTKIDKYTYSGHFENVIMKKQIVSNIIVDSEIDVLYYMTGRESSMLNKLSLVDSFSTTMADLGFGATVFIVSWENVFVYNDQTNELIILSGNQKEKIILDFAIPGDIRCCAIH